MTTSFTKPAGLNDFRLAAWSIAAASGLASAMALRFDWFLAAGIVDFQRTGQNVAAYAFGADLLPWALAFTTLAIAVSTAAFCAATWTRPSNQIASASRIGSARRRPALLLRMA